MIQSAFCIVALLPAFLSACGEDGGGREEAARGSPTIREAPRALTEEASGGSFRLAPGKEVSLQLSSEYMWSEPVVAGGAVELATVDYFQDPGFSEWLVTPVAPGTATIASVGTPNCPGQDGCPDEPLRFRVTITVSE